MGDVRAESALRDGAFSILGGYELVVLCMSSDPKPDEPLVYLYGQRSVLDADSHGQKMIDFFEVERRMI